jgi:hypothetical protein
MSSPVRLLPAFSILTGFLAASLLTAPEAAAQSSGELRSAAPLAMKKEWLGYAMRPDFSAPTTTRAIRGDIVSTDANAFNSEVSELRSESSVAAALSGFGATLDVSASASKRFALFRVYKIARIDELDMTTATVAPDLEGAYVPSRIYYGWALYVLVEGDAATFSAAASARIFSVDAKVKAQASHWGLTVRVALRGLDSKVAGEIVVPRDVADIVEKFQVATDTPAQPILAEYTRVGAPAQEDLAWAQFQEPAHEDFDGAYAKYRLYRDPRVAPGVLRVRMVNLHGSDRAVWEIWQRGQGRHTYRWEQGGSSTLEREVPIPSWPMDLVWVGHATRTPNATPDRETGWTLDWVRVK